MSTKILKSQATKNDHFKDKIDKWVNTSPFKIMNVNFSS